MSWLLDLAGQLSTTLPPWQITALSPASIEMIVKCNFCLYVAIILRSFELELDEECFLDPVPSSVHLCPTKLIFSDHSLFRSIGHLWAYHFSSNPCKCHYKLRYHSFIETSLQFAANGHYFDTSFELNKALPLIEEPLFGLFRWFFRWDLELNRACRPLLTFSHLYICRYYQICFKKLAMCRSLLDWRKTWFRCHITTHGHLDSYWKGLELLRQGH